MRVLVLVLAPARGDGADAGAELELELELPQMPQLPSPQLPPPPFFFAIAARGAIVARTQIRGDEGGRVWCGEMRRAVKSLHCRLPRTGANGK